MERHMAKARLTIPNSSLTSGNTGMDEAMGSVFTKITQREKHTKDLWSMI